MPNIEGIYRDRTLLQSSLREFLEGELGDISGLAGIGAAVDLRRAAWLQLAAQGWLESAVPGDDRPQSAADLAIIHEEFGAYIIPLPLLACSHTVALLSDAEAGWPPRVQALRDGIVSGAMAVAATAISVSEAATPDGGVRAEGVLGTDLASHLLVMDAGESPQLTLVRCDHPGVGITPARTSATLPLASVSVSNAALADGESLARGARVVRATRRARALAQVLLAAEMAGAAGTVLRLATAYARDRVQFGRPIGSFQAIQHKLAEMALARDSAQALVRSTAATLTFDEPGLKRAGLAKLSANIASRKVAFEAHQIFAGTGFMAEHPLHVYTFNLALQEQLLGTTEFLRRHHTAYVH